ncbi:hypothetical protein B0H17DRAFT_1143583 [Mycena rosella]|uniref:Uncharacterized protein n=1 Tax=Mycena rosella TaxID=1033263 RepID=A0AAD7CVH6_MYCRO|nr:hypothetical protein B0H17DRAFT_1143583 [Mycena rosella]
MLFPAFLSATGPKLPNWDIGGSSPHLEEGFFFFFSKTKVKRIIHFSTPLYLPHPDLVERSVLLSAVAFAASASYLWFGNLSGYSPTPYCFPDHYGLWTLQLQFLLSIQYLLTASIIYALSWSSFMPALALCSSPSLIRNNFLIGMWVVVFPIGIRDFTNFLATIFSLRKFVSKCIIFGVWVINEYCMHVSGPCWDGGQPSGEALGATAKEAGLPVKIRKGKKSRGARTCTVIGGQQARQAAGVTGVAGSAGGDQARAGQSALPRALNLNFDLLSFMGGGENKAQENHRCLKYCQILEEEMVEGPSINLCLLLPSTQKIIVEVSLILPSESNHYRRNFENRDKVKMYLSFHNFLEKMD